MLSNETMIISVEEKGNVISLKFEEIDSRILKKYTCARFFSVTAKRGSLISKVFSFLKTFLIEETCDLVVIC